MKVFQDFVQSFIIVVLVVSGIGGILYHIFRQAGWGTVMLDKTFELYLLHPGVMIPATVVAVVIAVVWYEHRMATGKYNKKVPTYVLYALMAAGVYFIGHYAIYGQL